MIFFNMELAGWISLKINWSSNDNVGQISYWETSCHAIWYLRYKDEHIKDFARPFDSSLHVSLQLKENGETLKMNNMTVGISKEIKLVKWDTPSPCMVKLNVGGACIKGIVACCRGIVRDYNGCWICGFTKNVNICSSYIIELWGLL